MAFRPECLLPGMISWLSLVDPWELGEGLLCNAGPLGEAALIGALRDRRGDPD